MKYVKQFSIILGISFLAELLEILIPLPIAAKRLWSGDYVGGADHEADPAGKGGDRGGFPRGCHVHYVRARYRGNHGKCECFKRDAASHLCDHSGIHGTDHDRDRPGIPAYYPGAEQQRCRSHADGRKPKLPQMIRRTDK